MCGEEKKKKAPTRPGGFATVVRECFALSFGVDVHLLGSFHTNPLCVMCRQIMLKCIKTFALPYSSADFVVLAFVDICLQRRLVADGECFLFVCAVSFVADECLDIVFALHDCAQYSLVLFVETGRGVTFSSMLPSMYISIPCSRGTDVFYVHRERSPAVTSVCFLVLEP